MAKGWTHIGNNSVEKTEDIQKVINAFNKEIRNMNTMHYKKKIADARKTAIAEKKKKEK